MYSPQTLASIAATLSLFCNVASASSLFPTATIDAGVIVGIPTHLPDASTTVSQFLGIPFAAPPKRFAPAQKVKPWSKPLQTKKRGPSCVQQFSYPEASRNFSMRVYNTPAPEESEDCLFVNVFAPSKSAPKGGRAVMFWIFGGGLYFGHAGHPVYDGSYFAAHEDVIVVAANYRTNAFGFANSPEIPLENRNLGFLDQRFALDWVQRNIHAFGGNPNKVTIFGESAGSFSIDALLTSTSNSNTLHPPFRAAILQSGQLSYRGNPGPGKPYASGRPAWDALAAGLNCTSHESNLTCIAAAPASSIKSVIEHQASFFTPTVDNRTYLADPARARRSGTTARIPILSGSNANEGRILVVGQENVTAYLEYTLGDKYTENPELVERIRAAYPVGGNEFPTGYDAIAAMETHVSFQCGEALVANDTAELGVSSWRYFFNATFANTQRIPDGRAYHFSEIEIVFGTFPRENATEEEYALSERMRGAWAKFAKDPEAGPGWSALGNGTVNDVAVFQNGAKGMKMESQHVLDEKCALWREVIGASG